MRPLLATLVFLASFLGAAAVASAQYNLAVEPEPPSTKVFSDLELALDLGVMDRGSSGVGSPLLGYGYDHDGGLFAAASVRLYFHDDDMFWLRHGIGVRFAHHAGDDFGLGDTGFFFEQIDVGYVVRTEFPCMSQGDRHVYLSGILGVTTVVADASTGNRPSDGNWNARTVAASELDHVGVGGLLGVALDVHFGAAFAGVYFDVREQLAVTPGPISRDFSIAAALRGGVDIGL
jgi:hypothetical protein